MPLRRLTRARSRRGFSLIEVAVAVFILTVGIIGVLLLFVVQLKDQAHSAGQTRALQVAQASIDSLKRANPTTVALSQGEWEELQAPSAAQTLAQWHQRARGDAAGQLHLASGVAAPVDTLSSPGYTIYTSVTCDQDENPGEETVDCADDVTGAAYDRTVQVVVVPRGPTGAATLVTRIGATQVGGAGSGDVSTWTGEAPGPVTATQIEEQSSDGDNGLQVSWDPVPGAVRYEVYDEEEPDDKDIVDAVFDSFKEASVVGERAGGTATMCVVAVSAAGRRSPATCSDPVLLRPARVLISEHPGGGYQLEWQGNPLPASAGVEGYVVERIAPAGSWQAIAGPQSAGTLIDPDGTCVDRYQVKVFRTGVLVDGAEPPGAVEGVDYAKSSLVVPSC